MLRNWLACGDSNSSLWFNLPHSCVLTLVLIYKARLVRYENDDALTGRKDKVDDKATKINSINY